MNQLCWISRHGCSRLGCGRHNCGRRPARPTPGEEGFSLVELMLGLVASVLVVGAILSMTVHDARHNKANQEVHLAFVACSNNLEELRTVPIASLPSFHGVGFDIPGPNGEAGGLNPVPDDDDGLAGRFSVTVDQTSYGRAVYVVRATVTWEGSLRPQSFALETLMGKRDDE